MRGMVDGMVADRSSDAERVTTMCFGNRDVAIDFAIGNLTEIGGFVSGASNSADAALIATIFGAGKDKGTVVDTVIAAVSIVTRLEIEGGTGVPPVNHAQDARATPGGSLP